jgi:hypothetical protein
MLKKEILLEPVPSPLRIYQQLRQLDGYAEVNFYTILPAGWPFLVHVENQSCSLEGSSVLALNACVFSGETFQP